MYDGRTFYPFVGYMILFNYLINIFFYVPIIYVPEKKIYVKDLPILHYKILVYPNIMSLKEFQNLIQKLLKKKNVIKKQVDKGHDNLLYSKTADNMIKLAFPDIKPEKSLFGFLRNVFRPLIKQMKVESDWKETLLPFKELVSFLYTKDNTLSGYYVIIRNDIRAALDLVNVRIEDDKTERVQWSFRYWGDKDLTAKMKADKGKKHTKDANERGKRVKYKLSQVKMAIEENINSDKWNYRMLAVELAAQSRGIEIMRVSRYMPVEGKPRWVKVVGVAKEGGGVDPSKIIIKPLLFITYNQLKEAVDFIREKRSFYIKKWGKDNRGLGNSFSRLYNQAVKTIFPALTAHKLRGLGSMSSFVMFNTGESDIIYLQKILGHNDVKTSVRYSLDVVEDDLSDANFTPQEAKIAKQIGIVNSSIPPRVDKLEDEVIELKQKPIKVYEHPDLANSRSLSKEERMIRLKKLYDLGLTSARKLRTHGYGQKVISDFKKTLDDNAEEPIVRKSKRKAKAKVIKSM